VAANGVLQEFDTQHKILVQSHDEVPRLLARLRTAEDDEAEEIAKQKAAAVRRRTAAIEKIVTLGGELEAERARAVQALNEYADRAIQEWRGRLGAAAREWLARVEEGRLLGEALGRQVPCPLPIDVVERWDGAHVARPQQAEGAVGIDPEIAKRRDRLKEIDVRLALVRGIRQSHEFDQKQYALALERGQPTQAPGLFRVQHPFTCMTDNLEFSVGELIDNTLVGDGQLQRLLVGKRYILPAGFGA
jgi:hypothetical protein